MKDEVRARAQADWRKLRQELDLPITKANTLSFNGGFDAGYRAGIERAAPLLREAATIVEKLNMDAATVKALERFVEECRELATSEDR